MSLPYVRINFANGAIGGSAAMDDGCTGIVAMVRSAVGSINPGTPFLVTSLEELEAKGATEDVSETKALHKAAADFYSEAPKGTRLFVWPAEDEGSFDQCILSLQRFAKGEIRIVMCPLWDDTRITERERMKQMADMLMKGCLECIKQLSAPVIALMGAYVDPGDQDTSEYAMPVRYDYGRVGVVVGDYSYASKNASVGLVAGRMAAIPVQRSIGRVRDGAIAVPSGTYMTVRGVDAAQMPYDLAEALHKCHYIFPRTFTGKSGYYWADDPLATEDADDYCLIPRRRVADKAYRVAYKAMLDDVNDEIAVTAEGKIVPAVAKGIETAIESAVVKNMTRYGNLSTDPDDPNDTGVIAYVDPDQDIVATSHLDVKLRIRPYGYAKYIDVDLGFQTTNN